MIHIWPKTEFTKCRITHRTKRIYKNVSVLANAGSGALLTVICPDQQTKLVVRPWHLKLFTGLGKSVRIRFTATDKVH